MIRVIVLLNTVASLDQSLAAVLRRTENVYNVSDYCPLCNSLQCMDLSEIGCKF